MHLKDEKTWNENGIPIPKRVAKDGKQVMFPTDFPGSKLFDLFGVAIITWDSVSVSTCTTYPSNFDKLAIQPESNPHNKTQIGRLDMIYLI